MKARVYELWIHITSDKRKSGVLLVLLVVLGLFGIRAALQAGPSRAGASIAGSSQSTVREQLDERFARTMASIESGNRGPFIELTSVAHLERNLFRLDSRFFPEPVQPDQTEHVPPKVVAQPGESVDVTPEVGLKEQVLAESERLLLRSTLVGSTPIAVIEVVDGRGKRRVVLSPGQGTEGFVLREVRSNTAILEKQGIRVELRRTLPEG